MRDGDLAATDTETGPERGGIAWSSGSAALLAGVVVVASSLHFWPFEGHKAWELLCPVNSVPLLWGAAMVVYACAKRNWKVISHRLPHVSVLAFLTINFLSAAFAQSAGRAVNFGIKLTLAYLGGYALFWEALHGRRAARVMTGAVLAVIACVCAAVIDRWFIHSRGIGFFANGYKYATYVGILASLGGTYLVLSPGWRRLGGLILMVLAVASMETAGGFAAIVAAMVVLAIVASDGKTRMWIAGVLLCSAGAALTLAGGPEHSLFSDVRFAETEGENLRQRYIEWQAEINLLEERAVTGTGAGSMNDYRSAYYYRLPKLNTLAAFDENGWLATAAQTGILGFVVFCWMAGHHVRRAWRDASLIEWVKPLNVTDRIRVAGLTGLAAAFVAHVFSSVHYNGVLIAFVLVLALGSRNAVSVEGR